MQISILVLLIFLTGCVSSPQAVTKTTPPKKEVDVITIQKEVVPQVWSDHKVLKISAETCALKGVDILSSLGFNQIVKNGTYVYGNYINNRAVIKCTSVNQQTFVYAVVAGPKVKVVERLRNEIVWQL